MKPLLIHLCALCVFASALAAQDANAPLDPAAGSAGDPAQDVPAQTAAGDASVSDAIDDAAKAAKGLGAALLDGAKDAFSSAESSVTEAAEELRDSMATRVTVMALSASDDMDALAGWIEQEDIVTKDGIDFAKALAAVDASDYSDDRKTAMRAAINSVRDALGQARRGLTDLNTHLQADG